MRLRERLATGEVVKVKHGELIPKGHRLKYLTQQAGRMRKLSLDPEIIRIALDIRAIRKCEDGRSFIVSHKPNLDFVVGLSEEGDYIMPTLKLDGRVIYKKPPGRHDLLVAAMKKFPDQITATEGYDLLEGELAGTHFRLDRRSKASQRAVKNAREEAGFKVTLASAPGENCVFPLTRTYMDHGRSVNPRSTVRRLLLPSFPLARHSPRVSGNILAKGLSG